MFDKLEEATSSSSSSTAAASASLIIISVILSTLVAATIVGNLFVILAILLDKNLQTTANQLVLSLAVADLMVACLVMPLGAYNDIHNGWYLSKEICEFWTSADVLCCTASILNLLAIAVDRYWAVTNVDYIYRRTRRRVNVMILCAWTVGAIVSLAPIFGWKDPDFAKRVIEEHKCMVSQDVSYQIFATISTFYAPLVLLLGLYWRIFQVARKRIRRKPGQTRGALLGPTEKQTTLGTSDTIVCQTAAAVAAAANNSKHGMPEQPLKSISGQIEAANNKNSFMGNCSSIRAPDLKASAATAAAAKEEEEEDHPNREVPLIVAVARSNYIDLRPTVRRESAAASESLATVDTATTNTTSKAAGASKTTAMQVNNCDKATPNFKPYWSAALDKRDKSAEARTCSFGEQRDDKCSIRGAEGAGVDDARRMRRRRRDCASGCRQSQTQRLATAANTNSNCSNGCSIRDEDKRQAQEWETLLGGGGRGNDDYDNKNNGPERLLAAARPMHEGPVSGGGESVSGKSKQDEHEDTQQQMISSSSSSSSGQRRKEGWRKNKVAPIEEAALVRAPTSMLSQGEGQDGATTTDDSRRVNDDADNCDCKDHDSDKWRRRRRLEARPAQAFGCSPSLSSSVSATCPSCWKHRRCQNDGAELFDAGTKLLLLSVPAPAPPSSSDGVKMNEGVAPTKQFNCSCLSLTSAALAAQPVVAGRDDSANESCRCYCQSGRLNGSGADNIQADSTRADRGGDRKELSSGHGRHGLACSRCKPPRWAQRGPEAAAAVTTSGSINHEPAAAAAPDGGGAYLVADSAVKPATECCAKNTVACLKLPSDGRLKDSHAEAAAEAAAAEARVLKADDDAARAAEVVVTAAANGLNNKLDKRTTTHSRQDTWACGRLCRSCESLFGGGGGGRGVSGPQHSNPLALATDINQPPTIHLVSGGELLPSSVYDDDDNLSATGSRKLNRSEAKGPGNYSRRPTADMDRSECASASDIESSLTASSSMLACPHRADDDDGQFDDDDDIEKSSSLSASFPPKPKGDPPHAYSSSSAASSASASASSSSSSLARSAQHHSSGGSAAKSHEPLTSRRADNNVRDFVAAGSTLSEVDRAPASPEPRLNANKSSVATNNLSTSAWLSRAPPPPPPPPLPKRLTEPILISTTTSDLSERATVSTATREQAPTELKAADKVKRKLDRKDPIQVQSMKWTVRLAAHSATVAETAAAAASQPRQARSSLQIRRRFRAMGQLVSFVQTSRNLNGSSSFSSNSASSLRSTLACSNQTSRQPTAAQRQQADSLGAAQTEEDADRIGPKSGAKPDLDDRSSSSSSSSLDEYDAEERAQRFASQRFDHHHHQDADAVELQPRHPHQLAVIGGGKMIDGNNALCQQQRLSRQPSTNTATNLVAAAAQPPTTGSSGAPSPVTLTVAPQFEPHSVHGMKQQQQHHHHHRRRKQMEMASEGAGGRTRSANMDIKREKKAAKTLAIITGVFVCCWLPFFLNAIIMPVCGPTCTPSDLVLSILLWLGYLNSLLNPIIYTIFSPDFRRAFRRLLCWPHLIALGCNSAPTSGSHGNW